ncbi:MAG TPA: hypothetical protein VEZ46_09765 [Mycobacteriales bacterium]|nr:hypothetical protein [Mycobacteriales bacterium]
MAGKRPGGLAGRRPDAGGGVFEVGVHPGGPVGLTLAVLEATRPSAETVAALA